MKYGVVVLFIRIGNEKRNTKIIVLTFSIDYVIIN